MVVNIGQKAGVGQYFNFTLEELNTALMAPTGVAYDELKKKGTVILKNIEWKEGWQPLKTPSGKVELYSKAFADAGFPGVPMWEAPLVKPEKDQFYLIHGKQAVISHTATANIPYLMEIVKKYNLERIWINAAKAAELGIKDGDTVIVENDMAKRTVKAKVTERIHPEAVWLPLGYGSFAKGLKTSAGFGISSNDFAPFRLEPISGHAMMAEAAVRIRKEGGK